ncbi:MAG: hypothetical protein ABIE07_12570 [Candidatus Zixiibacteriota bacterium]
MYYPILINEYGMPELQPLSLSLVDNHIGVCLVAITRDNYLLIWEQHKQTVIYPEFLVSSASGSVDWGDLDKKNKSLLKTIENAMKRELVEENEMNSPPEICIKVIGFYRQLSRCGKPEFIGITRIRNMDRSDISPLEGIEPSNDLSFELYVPTIDQLILSVKNALESPKLSPSLSGTFYCLYEYLTGQKSQAEKLLYK